MKKTISYLEKREQSLQLKMKTCSSSSKKFPALANELLEVQQALKEAEEYKTEVNKLADYLTNGEAGSLDDISVAAAIMKNRYLKTIEHSSTEKKIFPNRYGDLTVGIVPYRKIKRFSKIKDEK